MSYSLSSNFLKPVYQVTSHTTAQSSSASAGVLTTIDGTALSYTPASGATSVVYEVSFSMQKINDRYFQSFRLEYSTNGGVSYTEFNARYQRSVGPSGATGQAYRELRNFRWVLPAWSGSRDLRVVVGSYATGREAEYHGLDKWDGASAGSPTTVLTDTCLMVYSI